MGSKRLTCRNRVLHNVGIKSMLFLNKALCNVWQFSIVLPFQIVNQSFAVQHACKSSQYVEERKKEKKERMTIVNLKVIHAAESFGINIICTIHGRAVSLSRDSQRCRSRTIYLSTS